MRFLASSRLASSGQQTTLDQALPLVGGQNFLNLIEALTATAGFWYLRDAIRLYSEIENQGNFAPSFSSPRSSPASSWPSRTGKGQQRTFIDDHLAFRRPAGSTSACT